jgi:hypothetical protein
MGAFSTDSDLTNIAVSYNWIARPNLISDLRVGYTRANVTGPRTIQLHLRLRF